MTVMSQTYRNALHQELHELLCSEAGKRDQREDWITAERRALCEAVNRHRTRLGKSPLTMDDVERVEQQAVGHTDYARKFSLYCTELVEERP